MPRFGSGHPHRQEGRRSTWSPRSTWPSSACFREMIAERFPDHAVLGEEMGGSAEPPAGPCWVFDPIDGTTNFAHGLPIFCSSLALEIDGVAPCGRGLRSDTARAVHGGAGRRGVSERPAAAGFRRGDADRRPARHRLSLRRASDGVEEIVGLFAAFVGRARAVRRLGSAAIDLCYVAAGRMDGFWEARPQGVGHRRRRADRRAGRRAGDEHVDGTPFSSRAGQRPRHQRSHPRRHAGGDSRLRARSPRADAAERHRGQLRCILPRFPPNSHGSAGTSPATDRVSGRSFPRLSKRRSDVKVGTGRLNRVHRRRHRGAAMRRTLTVLAFALSVSCVSAAAQQSVNLLSRRLLAVVRRLALALRRTQRRRARQQPERLRFRDRRFRQRDVRRRMAGRARQSCGSGAGRSASTPTRSTSIYPRFWSRRRRRNRAGVQAAHRAVHRDVPVPATRPRCGRAAVHRRRRRHVQLALHGDRRVRRLRPTIFPESFIGDGTRRRAGDPRRRPRSGRLVGSRRRSALSEGRGRAAARTGVLGRQDRSRRVQLPRDGFNIRF